MRLCDEEGIVVIDETTAVGVNLQFGGGANFGGERIGTFDKEHGVQTQEHHKDVIRDLISRDKNHACVVMWSIANEPDSAAEGAYDYFKPLYDLARELDPQKRPCTLVSVQGTTADTDCSSQLSDVICLITKFRNCTPSVTEVMSNHLWFSVSCEQSLLITLYS